MDITLIFPHQLFRRHPALRKGRPVYLVEEWLYFRALPFHRQKLVLHRASMKAYADVLQRGGLKVHYVPATSDKCDVRRLIASLPETAVLHLAEPDDDWLLRRIRKGGREVVVYPTPAFLNTIEEGRAYFSEHAYFQTDFYKDQRRRRGLLMEGNKPLGGKWSYDSENRERLPDTLPLPALPFPEENPWVLSARRYVKQHFGDHYGSMEAPFEEDGSFYPVTHREAAAWLKDFLQHRLAGFGPYEDAQSGRGPVLFHSVLSPLINTGLLTPAEVVEAALDHAAQQEVPLNSLEGFLRQVVGWREYIRLVYHLEGRKQRTQNFWGFSRKIPESFWTGTTGIVPVDGVIRKVLRSGYCHHIERLMVLGNFFLLCEFDPDEVHRWFMELFIDAYDWVMVPNTYGMTQFSDGGLMMTKPYISGSNYLMKMGDWPKGPWQEVWDGLFWRFMDRQRAFFSQNPRLGMLLRTWDKMDVKKRKAHLRIAEAFLRSLDGGEGGSGQQQINF